MNKNHRFLSDYLSRLAATGLALAMILGLNPATAGAATSDLVIEAAMLRGDLTERASGEIHIAVAEIFFDRQGHPYQLTVGFPGRDQFEAAVTNPFEPISVAAFDNLFVRQSNGEISDLLPDVTKRQASIQHYLDKAESALCGSVLMRAVVELPSGIQMGVDFRATAERLKPFKLVVDKNTLPGDCVYDVFDHCDIFAWGGCGGPDCAITCEFGGLVYSILAACRENDVFGPNTCSCNP